MLSLLLFVNTSVKSTLKSLKKTKTQVEFCAIFVLRSKFSVKPHDQYDLQYRLILRAFVYRFPTLNCLTDHLEKSHKEDISSTQHFFTNYNEFKDWKRKEMSTRSLYVKVSGCRVHGVNRKRYFYCHRSGVFQTKGNGLRAMKTQGTCKIAFFCTAHMKVSEDTITGKVTVSYCKNHTGHDLEICHLRIPTVTKLWIASKLQIGVTVDIILDDVRDKVNVDGTIEREHLMSHQDIHNVQYHLNLESVEKHCNDHTSVSAWVAEMRGMAYNPVLVFKNQGVDQNDDCDNMILMCMILILSQFWL